MATKISIKKKIDEVDLVKTENFVLCKTVKRQVIELEKLKITFLIETIYPKYIKDNKK